MNTQTLDCASGESDSDANKTASVEADIAIAGSIMSVAESAFATDRFGTAEALHLQAEQQMAAILREICNLTDADAASVEPLFTEFEERLIRLRSALLERSPRCEE